MGSSRSKGGDSSVGAQSQDPVIGLRPCWRLPRALESGGRFVVVVLRKKHFNFYKTELSKE